MRLTRSLRFLVIVGAVSFAGPTMAASAIATTDVNLRAGPSTSYPVVDVVRGGDDVRVFGCLNTRSWCDVGFDGQRGWMSSNYLATTVERRRYRGPEVVGRIGAPTIGFSIGGYWGDHYRSRSFYRDRDRYDRRDRADRREFRQERRDVREQRRDVRDARRDLRDARRRGEDVRSERRNLRQERRELRQERREFRRERRD